MLQYVKFFVKFSNMRTRKCKKELESYEIANRSVYGWQTEKYFNDNLFDSSSDTKWYEEEEEPPAKKMKRLREAERAVASHTRQSHVKEPPHATSDPVMSVHFLSGPWPATILHNQPPTPPLGLDQNNLNRFILHKCIKIRSYKIINISGM